MDKIKCKHILLGGEFIEPKLTIAQLNFIQNVHNAIKDENDSLPLLRLRDILGNFIPEKVFSHLFVTHKHFPDPLSSDKFRSIVRLLLQGSVVDKIKVLFHYYTNGTLKLTQQEMAPIVEDFEGGEITKFDELFNQPQFNFERFRDFLFENPTASPMSDWILENRFSLALSGSTLKSPRSLLALHSNFSEDVIRALNMEFMAIGMYNGRLIDMEKFKASCEGIFPAQFVENMFRAFDLKRDGWIDLKEYALSIAHICSLSDQKGHEFLFRIFSIGNNGKLNLALFFATISACIPQKLNKSTIFSQSDQKKMHTLQDYCLWAMKSTAGQYLLKFLRIVCMIVFGLPPKTEMEKSDSILFWMHYILQKPIEIGSRWYLVDTKWWPSLEDQQSSKIPHSLPHLNSEDIRGSYHPVMMFQKLYGHTPTRGRLRSCSLDAISEITSITFRRKKKLHKKIHRFSRHRRTMSNLELDVDENNSLRSQSKLSIKERRSATKLAKSERDLRLLASMADTFDKQFPDNLSQNHSTSQDPFTSMKEPVLKPDENTSQIAVDERLSRCVQRWGIPTHRIPLMPSYLISKEKIATSGESVTETTLEMFPLEITVRWTSTALVNNTDLANRVYFSEKPPKLRLCMNHEPISNNSTHLRKDGNPSPYSQGTSVAEPSTTPSDGISAKHFFTSSPLPIGTKVAVNGCGRLESGSVSVVESNPNCISVAPQRISNQRLRFAFSRCHSLRQITQEIASHFITDKCDSSMENYRLWYLHGSLNAPENGAPARPKVSIGGSKTADNGRTPAIKLLSLQLVPNSDSQSLVNFLINSLPFSAQKMTNFREISDSFRHCSRIFEFVLESRSPAHMWPLRLNSQENDPSRGTEEQKNMIGLKNLGNTCYFNSVVQCLNVTQNLNQCVKENLHPKARLSNEYINLINQMNEGLHDWINPHVLRNCVNDRWSEFKLTVQQDAQEFLNIFIDELHEELKMPARDGSIKESTKEHKRHGRKDRNAWEKFLNGNLSSIINIFYGMSLSKIELSCCGKQSSQYDPFSCLGLPLLPDCNNNASVYVVPQIGAVPERHHFQALNTIHFNFLLNEICKRFTCTPCQVFFATFVRGHFTPLFNNGVPPTGVVHRSYDGAFFPLGLWAFIFPAPASRKRVNEMMTIIVHSRILVPAPVRLFEETSTAVELFGLPQIMQIPVSSVNAKLYQMAETAVGRFISAIPDAGTFLKKRDLDRLNQGSSSVVLTTSSEDSVSSGIDKFNESSTINQKRKFFQLKIVEESYRKCGRCSWPRMCRGCTIPNDDTNVNLPRGSDGYARITIDWDTSVYVSDYKIPKELDFLDFETVEQKADREGGSSISLDEVLAGYFASETLSDDQALNCESCKCLTTARKSTSLCKLPETLVILLKRFQPTSVGWCKCKKQVDFPLSGLDMRPYLSKQKTEDSVYDLYGVINHIGTMDIGHYYAFCRLEDGRWFQANDCECNEIKHEAVVTPNAYVLFYQRRKTVSKL